MADTARSLSTGQVSFFLAYAWTLSLWLASEFLHYTNVRRWSSHSSKSSGNAGNDLEGASLVHLGTDGIQSSDATAIIKVQLAQDGSGGLPGTPRSAAAAHLSGNLLAQMADSPFVHILMFDRRTIMAARTTLRAMAEFGLLMCWYYLCDRTAVLGEGDKFYNRDQFMFLFVILTAVAVGCSLQIVKPPQPALLGRQQTEEWKGWMQVLFLLYHYFEAKEFYNAIRLFIAAYVWMTGFGNFLYYFKTNDFSIGRFAGMMWRLNFLVLFACVVLENSYMLYYICPMHTLFTLMVYASLGIASHLNQNRVFMLLKLLCCVAAVVVLWDIKPVFYAIWWPFTWLVGYTDPRKPGDDPLHEWYFRSSLDRYIWIYGMLCAMMHPWASGIVNWIDGLPLFRRAATRTTILSICGVVGYVWYTKIYTLPRMEYNAVHPFTSWIPITLWAVMRNMTPTLRLHHLRLYGWLGCITLETYICQFHIWMRTDVPDGQPKQLLVLIPGYPLLNFALVTGLYILVSHRLFELTNALKTAAMPSSNQLLLRNMIILALAGTTLYLSVYGGLNLFVYQVL